MVKSIDKAEAKRVIQLHRSILTELLATERLHSVQKEEIANAAEAFVAQEVMRLLKDISIEELNRERRGIRVKLLRDHGYSSIADISSASIYAITSIHGISEDAARTIKQITANIVDVTRKNAKIRISEDNKTPQATRLVTAISRFRSSKTYISECETLVKHARPNIERGIEDLALVTKPFRWFFASKSQKERAGQAFEMLTALFNEQYYHDARSFLDALNGIERNSSNAVWEDFAKNPVQFFNVLESIVPGVLGTDDSVYGLPEALAQEIQDQAFFPEGLLCELRRYQEWGAKYILHQERVLLGDEMGLGKTIQAIAAMVSLKNTGVTHFVVVCPASVLTNWCREIQKMSRLSVIKIHGYDRSSALQSWIQTGGVL